MAANNQQKKMDAFYHNQRIDYDRWLMANTIDQQRQRYISTAKTRNVLAATFAMAAGFAQRY